MSAIELSAVTKNFGRTEIIRGVDLSIRTGERHAMIGPNGAGKSTLLNTISGLTTVHAGRIRFEEAVHRRHKALKTSVVQFLRESSIPFLLTADVVPAHAGVNRDHPPSGNS